MKIFTALLLSFSVITYSTNFFAESDIPQPENEVITTESINPEMLSDAIGIEIKIDKKTLVVDSTALFELYDENGNLLASCENWIGGDTEMIYPYFRIPQYTLGTSFELKLVSGLTSMQYYSDTIFPGGTAKLDTYIIYNEDGTYFQGNNFALNACPIYEKGINIYYHDSMLEFYSHPRIIDGVAMASAFELSQALKLQYTYDSEYNSVSLKSGYNEILLNLDDTYTTVFGNDTYISHAPVWVGDSVYIPIRDVCEAFGCTLTVPDFDDHIDIILSDATLVTDYLNDTLVSRYGINSDTDYLVWISKSDFRVRVYLGSQYNWLLEYECPCGIGAWNTPTVEGEFEYQYRVSSWDYPGYYVGPVLVFYGGYALHSTLLNYDGSEYDGTVEEHISHGCVRMHPQDINWIASHIPVGTKIYITG